MKRIFTFLLLALFAVVFTTVHAQHNIFIWENGNLSVKPIVNIDSLTTSVCSGVLNVNTSAASSVTENSFAVSVNVSFANNIKSLSLTPEVGLCFSSTKEIPTCADEAVRLGKFVTNYDLTLYELDPGTTYYYRAYVKLGAEVFYGDVQSIKTLGEKPATPNYILINGHKFVDLGLSSGLLWARTNVGAVFSSDDGSYFAWGETEPKTNYNWTTYKWGNASSKYNSLDSKTILDTEDDVVTVKWGTPCRIPSLSDFSEIENECKWLWTSDYNGASGYIVTGPNGNSIFLPASGCFQENVLNYNGSDGYYWSRSLHSSKISYACNLHFYHDRINSANFDCRFLGLPIRPVAER